MGGPDSCRPPIEIADATQNVLHVLGLQMLMGRYGDYLGCLALRDGEISRAIAQFRLALLMMNGNGIVHLDFDLTRDEVAH